MIADMGKTVWHQFSGESSVVGTRGVCGCIGIAIIGQTGAVVSHISPAAGQALLAQLQNTKTVFDRNLKNKGALLSALMWYPSDFAGILKNFPEDIEKGVKIMLGHDVDEYSYERTENERDTLSDGPDGAKYGTMVISKEGGDPEVFLNDHKV